MSVSLMERDLQLKTSYASSPPCKALGLAYRCVNRVEGVLWMRCVAECVSVCVAVCVAVRVAVRVAVCVA